MNFFDLNEDVLLIIYKFKHIMEYKDVMRELTTVNCFCLYNFEIYQIEIIILIERYFDNTSDYIELFYN